jgi:hypothetical protein
METIEQKQLSAELQELYLQNKELHSDILFIEDEMRFFKKLFDQVISLAIHEERIEELHPVNKSLIELTSKRKELKDLIIKHQQVLEGLLKDQSKPADLELIIDHAQIIEDIKALFAEEKIVRKGLYLLTEDVFDQERRSHLLTK